MNYFSLVTEVQDRLNMTSPESGLRIGRAINRRYRAITSSLGLETSRRTVLQENATLGVNSITFEGAEKILALVDRSVTPYKILDEVSIYELKDLEFTGRSTPTQWAVQSITSNTVTVQLDCVPQTAFTLYADALANLAILTSQLEPVFPESFHDVLIWGALADEYRKLEKPALAKDAEMMYDDRLSALRMYLATSAHRDIYQGKVPNKSFSGSGGGSSSSVNGATSYTQTGLVTFDRSSAGAGVAPFSVITNGLVVNLNADLFDGLDSTAFMLVGTAPSAHKTTHQDGGSDEISVAGLSGLLADAQAPLAHDASLLTSGIVPDARFPATLPVASGVNLTNLNATQLTTGILPLGRLDNPFTCDGRLTLTTGVPVTTADVIGATNIFFTPYKGNRVSLYDGVSRWNTYTFAEKTLALGTITSAKPYDVFIYDNAGVPTLELFIWTNDTTRATALTTQDGVLVKLGSATRRYLGTFYTTSTTTTEDSNAKRYLWNYYHRIKKPMRAALETADSWNYTIATLRQANANTANQLNFVIGVDESQVNAHVMASCTNVAAFNTVALIIGIGLDSTSANAAGFLSQAWTNGQLTQAMIAKWEGFTGVGKHFLAWLEYSTATGTTTWYGDQGAPTLIQSGIHGSFDC